MHTLVKPIFYVMNKLSYSLKFILLCSVFAIPLSIFAYQLAESYHQRAEQAEITQRGLAYIQKTTVLIHQLELMRDLKVITSWRADPEFQTRYLEARANVLLQIDELTSQTVRPSRLAFLKELKDIVTADEMVKGTESRSIDTVYENAQQVLEKIYNWRMKLSYGFVSISENNPNILAIINILNDLDNYTETLGEARSYGSLYLAQHFINSNGIQVLEKVYLRLTQLAEMTDLKELEYQVFLASYPEARLGSIKNGVLEGREELYQRLIMAQEVNSDPLKYFEELSASMDTVYAHKIALFKLSGMIVEQDYQKSIQNLGTFYVGLAFGLILLVYLILGLYYSVSITIKELLRAAKAFSAGNYNKPVKIVSNDELMAVAEAMDIMRINIKEREERLARMSQTDGLTQLSNRKFFDNALQISLANSRRNMTPMSLLMMDIDHFKKVNDDYGHLAGDECLIQIAQLMKQQFQRQTDVVARYGGEEFVAILYGQSLEDALSQSEKLREIIAHTEIVSGETRFKVTASFGLATLVPPVDAQPQDLLALADALLYRSKDNGRNQINADIYRQLPGR